MKRIFVLCLIILGISFLPVSNQFSASAGRTGLGYTGSYCDCGCPSPPVCYEGDIVCSTAPGSEPGPNCNSGRRSANGEQQEKGSIDLGSMGLLFLAGMYMLKRFI